MTDYRITWITENLAVGHAPMSYEDLEIISKDGIDAIVNLCAEYCDLHEIEAKSGFEVYYLPMPDECAPCEEELEKALDWLDEALYLGKRILVHCRFGVGRTGTFVISYLIRKGMRLKHAEKALKQSCAEPSSHSQWRFLRKYARKLGLLKKGLVSLEARPAFRPGTVFRDYEDLIDEMEARIRTIRDRGGSLNRCGKDNMDCCFRYLELPFLETAYIHYRMNRTLSQEQRRGVIQKAVALSRAVKALRQDIDDGAEDPEEKRMRFLERYREKEWLCPLNQDSLCLLYDYRPVRCRLFGVPENTLDAEMIEKRIKSLSIKVYGDYWKHPSTCVPTGFSMADSLSGRFVQDCFQGGLEEKNRPTDSAG